MKQGPATRSHACGGGVITEYWAELTRAELVTLLNACAIPFVSCVALGHLNLVVLPERSDAMRWVHLLKDRINSGAAVSAMGEVPSGGALFTFSIITTYKVD